MSLPFKIHYYHQDKAVFGVKYVKTACGICVNEKEVEVTTDLDDVTCQNCIKTVMYQRHHIRVYGKGRRVDG